ncbi:MAG: hypothetical protein J7J43_05970 [Thermosipho sp. (in: Bacteria)]|nr:hypothetical protein [Thermosipho sp. (in: thermotogales)]
MTSINVETLITILFLVFFVYSILKKIFVKKTNAKKIIFTTISIIISFIFFFIFFSIFLFNSFIFEFFPPIMGLEILIKIFILIIFTLAIVSINFAILKNIFSKTQNTVENELKKSNLESKTIEAFKKLGASPSMSYSKINELLYEKVKKINADPKLSLIEKEKKIKELDEAFDVISDYYKSKN